MSTLPDFPQRPDDVPADITIDELYNAYSRHLFTAVMANRPGQAAVAAEQVSRHVLAALAIGQAVVDTFAGERWPLVRRGLAHGATVSDVGAALGGLEVDEVAAGLTSWADREHQAGLLDDAAYDAVLALVAGGAR